MCNIEFMIGGRLTVPNLWDKTPEAPSPELNPLTNPVLEQNLGRWAKVYFSTPPAKREQAVSNLARGNQAGIGRRRSTPVVPILQPIRNSSVRFAPLANITIRPVTSSAAVAGKLSIRHSLLRTEHRATTGAPERLRQTPRTMCSGCASRRSAA